MNDLLVRLLNPGIEASYKPADDDFWYERLGGSSSMSGVAVTDETAMRISAFFACTRVIAETMGYLPWFVYQRRQGGGRDRATEHPMYRRLHDEPNRWQTAFEWKEVIAGHIIMRGKHYSRMVRQDERGLDYELIPIHPDRVTEEKLASGNRRWRVRNEPGEAASEETLMQDEVLYIPGMWGGLSILEAARETLGEAIAAQRYSARGLANGVRSSGVLTHPKSLSDPAAKRLREQWTELYAGSANAGKTVILEEDMKYQSVSMTNEDFQFMQLRQGGVSEIARDFRMPLIMIQEQEKSTSWGTGVEQQQIGFVVFTMLPWCGRFEKRGNMQLLPISPGFFTEFEVDALLRGDAKSRADALAIERDRGVINADEWRLLNNRNPIEDGTGKDYWRPANFVTADTPSTPPSSPTPAGRGATGSDPRAAKYARVLAGQVVRKETERMKYLAKRYAADGVSWQAEVTAFYEEMAEDVARRCYVEASEARRYVESQRERVIEHGAREVESWESEKVGALTALMLEAA